MDVGPGVGGGPRHGEVTGGSETGGPQGRNPVDDGTIMIGCVIIKGIGSYERR